MLNNVLFILSDVTDTFCKDTYQIWRLVGRIIKIIQLVIPALLVLWGLLDLGKATLSGDEKERKEALSTLLKRFLYGLAVFFVIAIVKGVVHVVNKDDEGIKSTCWSCVEKPDDTNKCKGDDGNS